MKQGFDNKIKSIYLIYDDNEMHEGNDFIELPVNSIETIEFEDIMYNRSNSNFGKPFYNCNKFLLSLFIDMLNGNKAEYILKNLSLSTVEIEYQDGSYKIFGLPINFVMADQMINCAQKVSLVKNFNEREKIEISLKY